MSKLPQSRNARESFIDWYMRSNRIIIDPKEMRLAEEAFNAGWKGGWLARKWADFNARAKARKESAEKFAKLSWRVNWVRKNFAKLAAAFDHDDNRKTWDALRELVKACDAYAKRSEEFKNIVEFVRKYEGPLNVGSDAPSRTIGHGMISAADYTELEKRVIASIEELGARKYGPMNFISNPEAFNLTGARFSIRDKLPGKWKEIGGVADMFGPATFKIKVDKDTRAALDEFFKSAKPGVITPMETPPVRMSHPFLETPKLFSARKGARIHIFRQMGHTLSLEAGRYVAAMTQERFEQLAKTCRAVAPRTFRVADFVEWAHTTPPPTPIAKSALDQIIERRAMRRAELRRMGHSITGMAELYIGDLSQERWDLLAAACRKVVPRTFTQSQLQEVGTPRKE